MTGRFVHALILALVSLASVAHATISNLGSFENLHVEQVVDLTRPYVRQSFDLRVVNVGEEPASSYFFPVPEGRASSLAAVEARDGGNNVLVVRRFEEHPTSGNILYEIVLKEPLAPKQKLEIGYVLQFVDGFVPHPAAAKQSDTQMLLYEGTKNALSIYRTREQTLQLRSITGNIDDISGDSDKTLKVDESGTVTFGPYEKLQPLEVLPFRLRFENPLPVTRVENLNRTVWVSHWGGSVSFDESYDLYNAGTQLSSPFSRASFANPRVGFSLNTAALRLLRINLPVSHREEYYVDLVGNVSTSRVSPGVLEIAPRYPVMGGWFYNFTVGWAADIANYVHETSSGNFILGVPIIGGPDPVSYRKVVNKVVLPEGASNIEVYTDVPSDQLSESVTFSYLDLYGRPTVELEYGNLLSEHASKNLYVTYRYPVWVAYRKPASYSVLAFLAFVAYKFATRLF